jgi:hypothetical protein
MPPAAPTVVTGIRSSAVGVLAARRIVEMRDRIFDYDPDTSPFLTILSKRAAAVKASSPEYNHLEDQPLPWWDVLGVAITVTTATTITVTNGAYFRPGDLILVPSSTLTGGEYMKVTAVAGAVLTVVRNYTGDGVTGGTAIIGSYVAIVGNVNEENATVRQIKTTTESQVTNYTQIIRTPFGASNTLQATALYGGSERPRQRRKMATQHAFEQERAFLFGKKQLTTGPNGHRERSTGGLLSWIVSNVTAAGGTLTQATLESWAETMFRYGSGTKLVLASRKFATQLDNLAAGKLQTVPRADTYGVNVKSFVSAHGEFMVSIHDMLINDYSGYAIAVDMDNVMKRYLSDDDGARDGRLRTNVQDPSADGFIDEYLSEVGLHVLAESSFGVLKGF